MGSEILIVITGAVAMTVLAAGFYLIQPVFLEVQTNPNAACQANERCMAVFDTQYNVQLMIYEVFLGGIILSLYIRAVRKSAVETVGDF